MHVVCMMNGNVDDAVCWIQRGQTRSGQIYVHICVGQTVTFCKLIRVHQPRAGSGSCGFLLE